MRICSTSSLAIPKTCHRQVHLQHHITCSNQLNRSLAASSMRFSFACTPSSVQSTPLSFSFCILPLCLPTVTHKLTNSFLHCCFPGTLMTTDISGWRITSGLTNDQGVGQCSYPTKVCALTLGVHFRLLLLAFQIPWS